MNDWKSGSGYGRGLRWMVVLGVWMWSAAACTSAGSTVETEGGDGGSGDTQVSSGEGGEGGGATPHVPPADIAPFQAVSVGLLPWDTTNISVSDVPGPAGCGLTVKWFASPPGDAHQVFVSIADGSGKPCSEGTYPVSPDCTSDPAEDAGKSCAEYRVWQTGVLSAATTAIGGTVKITRSEAYGGLCTVELALGFGAYGAYDYTFQVLDDWESTPLCQVVGP